MGAALPEAGMILLVGIVAGFILSLFVDEGPENNNDDAAADVAQSLLSFSAKVFFLALLPPIIFNSGYHLRRGTKLQHDVCRSLLSTFAHFFFSPFT